MNERPIKVENVVRVLVIGTFHEYQRHQDIDKDREAFRDQFEQLLRKEIRERDIKLVAEEASKKEEVWAALKAHEAQTAAFNRLYADTKFNIGPQDTIAELVVRKEFPGCHYFDIRPPDAGKMTREEKDSAMFSKVLEGLGSATAVLVISGEDHRNGLCQRFKEQGFQVESSRFPVYECGFYVA